jgi:glycerol dehydrogenase-like iron-containing ADH family enzyme
VTPPDRSAASPAVPALGGHPGSVLVIADNAAVARRAVAWANVFTALGRLHRVRLISRAAGDVDGLVAEAVDVNATAILAAGGEAARQAAQAVAARLGLPLAIDGDPAFPDN